MGHICPIGRSRVNDITYSIHVLCPRDRTKVKLAAGARPPYLITLDRENSQTLSEH